MAYFVLYDAEHLNEKPVLGIFDDEMVANTMADILAIKYADECLAEDPEETGLTMEDADWLIKDCRKTIGIQRVENLNSFEAFKD